MNRAVRRQQVKEKPGKSSGQSRAIPHTGTSGGTAPRAAPFWRPRILTEVISELRKVIWPARQEVVNLTIVIVIVTLIIGALLGGIDQAFGWAVDHYLLR
jgi:preprotein translocase subunit SecE